MSPIDQKTRPLKENHLIQRVLHRPVEPAGLLKTWLSDVSFRSRICWIGPFGCDSEAPR
jgi:hypothetical protein